MTARERAAARPAAERPATVRRARREDAAGVWSLVHDSGVLDENSPYCYLLAAEELADTFVVAERDGALVGFCMALIPPSRPETVFVWQVGVAASERGRGLGHGLLREVVAGCPGVTHLEATVTPSNSASRALFQSFARRAGASCEVRPHFLPRDFPAGDHEPEELFRIGPIPPATDPRTSP